MIHIITIPENSSFFETSLGGETVRIDLYYSKTSDRYLMDIENKRMKRKSVGLPVNVGVDLLESSGHLGLEALMLVSMPQPLLEGSLSNYSEGLKLVYMDLATYSELVLQGGTSRQQWVEQTPNGI